MKKYFLLICSFFCFGVSQGQYNVLLNFSGANGANPVGILLLSGNFLYGMTGSGGAYDSGCIFKIDTNGNQYQDLFDFNGINGNEPIASLILSGKELYGMTVVGGIYGKGTIFSIDTNGNDYRDLFDFNGIDGRFPEGSLVLSGRRLYGVTQAGGISDSGVVFSIDTDGSGYRDVFDFSEATGGGPSGTLTLSQSGSILYGITSAGGLYGWGTVFSIDTSGSNFRDKLDFNGNNGGGTNYISLTLWGNRLYTMTQGSTGSFIISIDTDGSRYEDLYNFNPGMSFWNTGTLALYGGVLYGMTQYGGRYDNGVLFSIDTTGGGYTDMYEFSYPYGFVPACGLVHSKNVLYGMTSSGGTNNDGVVFSYREVGLGVGEVTGDCCAIKVFPNPSNGFFALYISNINEKCNIEIYNVHGEKVLTETLRSAQGGNLIDLSGQPNGIYFYRVLKQTGELVGEGKVILEK